MKERSTASSTSQYCEARRLADLKYGRRVVLTKAATLEAVSKKKKEEGDKDNERQMLGSNLVAKLNVKAGEENHRVSLDFLRDINCYCDVIVLGADVRHVVLTQSQDVHQSHALLEMWTANKRYSLAQCASNDQNKRLALLSN